ncbi:lysophospholipid acyltransferase family protein [uncultured Maribacter sp.]|uniref:lysophospholipid acyltransferase family protein n=1 Tax=uncultured Maribacter sp. TaxID=431308 RepID=UPI0030D90846
MSGFIYSIIKLVVRTGLYTYHKKIVITGLDNIPTDKPILFLSNHQSALIDVLLIATDCQRKPFFLTRADVFSSSWLNRIFSYFRMLPIYRIRDGRETLANNNLIFNTCSEILNRGEALVIFPEANHNLQRRVRPLSKGFTRILLRSFELYPELDIQLVPVGLNYKNATHFPDEVAVHYGKSISAKSLFHLEDVNKSSQSIKDIVSSSLKKLTSHIPNHENYEATVSRLMNENVSFLDPVLVNEKVQSYSKSVTNSTSGALTESKKYNQSKLLFCLLNFPVILLWRLWLKPKVPEAEFIGTFRFAFSLILFPIYLLTLFISISFLQTIEIALLSIGLLTVFNILLIKLVLR